MDDRMATSVTCPKCQQVANYEAAQAPTVCPHCGALFDSTPEPARSEPPPKHPRKIGLSDEPSDMPRAHSLPYERHRREPDKIALEQEQESLTVDPARWNPVRIGLTVIFWAWLAILGMIALFTILWLGVFFKFVTDDKLIRTVGWIVKIVVLVALLASLVGQCLCVLVPKAAAARIWIVGAIVGTLAFGSCAVFVLVVPQPPPPAPAPVAKVEDEVKPEAPPPQEGDAKPEPPAPRAPSITLSTQLPGTSISKPRKIWLLATFVLSQFLFVTFLKKVTLFFHDLFLAESTGGYLTLLTLHAAVLALLPPEALVACFFWVVMLALEFLLVVWFLVMVRGRAGPLVKVFGAAGACRGHRGNGPTPSFCGCRISNSRALSWASRQRSNCRLSCWAAADGNYREAVTSLSPRVQQRTLGQRTDRGLPRRGCIVWRTSRAGDATPSG